MNGWAADRSPAEAALDAWFLHDWWEDWDVPAAQGTTDKVLAVLRSLLVEQRMEAMGMIERRASFDGQTFSRCWIEAVE